MKAEKTAGLKMCSAGPQASRPKLAGRRDAGGVSPRVHLVKLQYPLWAACFVGQANLYKGRTDGAREE
jgi:hypothetical protein